MVDQPTREVQKAGFHLRRPQAFFNRAGCRNHPPLGCDPPPDYHSSLMVLTRVPCIPERVANHGEPVGIADGRDPFFVDEDLTEE